MSMNLSVFTIGLPILLGGLVNTVLFSFAAIALGNCSPRWVRGGTGW